MKTMYKVLATASILATIALPITTSAQNISHKPANYKLGHTKNQHKMISGTMGQITNYVNDKTGRFITVKGHGINSTDQNEIILSITNKTKIVDAFGKKVSDTVIKEKMFVKVFYSANITKSMPARSTALTLVVQEQKFTGIEGSISEVTKKGIVVNGTDIYTSNKDTIVLNFAKKTTLIDQNGKIIKAKDLQPGMRVKAFYGPAVTMSLPPQATTNFVIVNTETKQEEVTGTDGIITNITDNKISVVGTPLKNGGVNYVILTVDDKTEIMDQNGKLLTSDALKADIRVHALYGKIMPLIYPAQMHAEKIVIQNTEVNKIEGTVVASERTTKDQIYVNVGSDHSQDNDIILNISDNTIIIPILGKEANLFAGTKIVAYHKPNMTKSLPAITNAEIIMITSDDNAVSPK